MSLEQLGVQGGTPELEEPPWNIWPEAEPVCSAPRFLGPLAHPRRGILMEMDPLGLGWGRVSGGTSLGQR